MTGKTAIPTRTAKPSSTTPPVRFGVASRRFAPPVPWIGVNQEVAALDVAPLPLFRFGKIPIQAKLTVGPEGDAFEEEADATAERVMRTPDPATKSGAEEDEDAKELRREKWEQLHPGDAGKVQRKCDACAIGDEGKKLQGMAAGGGAVAQKAAPAIVHEVLRSPGQPLDAGTRAYMEPRFGHDFSQVRLHTDAKAAESARAVNAIAYTVGRDVVMQPDQQMQSGQSSQLLLAHELAHVVQQGNRKASMPEPIAVNPASDAAEHEAEELARTSVHGGRVPEATPKDLSVMRLTPA